MTRIIDIRLDGPDVFLREAPADGRVFAVYWKDGGPAAAEFLSGRDDAMLRDIARRAEALRSAAAAPGAPRPPASGAIASVVTAVVSTRNRTASLPACLESLRRQDHPFKDLVVVDNDPEDDRTRRLVDSDFPEVRYVVEPRRGLRFARNRGIVAAAGDVVAFIDDDCEALPGWMSALARWFADPAVGCCTGPLLPLRLASPAQEWLELRGGFSRGYDLRRYRSADFEGPRARHMLQAWQFGSGGNMALRREFFREHGSFDEVLPTAEDLDIFFRVLRAGLDIVYDPRATVRHDHPAGTAALRRRLYGWGWAYTAFLASTADKFPDVRRAARDEMRSWVKYQLLRRVRGREHPLPWTLIAGEIAGGLAGPAGYRRRRRKARRGAPPCPPSR